jgi:two-component system, NtrC family, sensor histidine kinase HydH
MLITTVLKYLIGESSLLAPDFASFRRQEFAFIGLNIFLAVALLLTQIAFPDQFGRPESPFFVLLGAWIAFNCSEFLWLRSRVSLDSESAVLLTWTMIVTSAAVAFGLAYLSYRQDIQYFTLIIGPIFQAAFRLSLRSVLITLGVSDTLIFFWVWNYFRLHPPADINEYVEAATISVIYTVTGLLVWILVNHLRSNQVRLARNLAELEATRSKLIQQEKLAAVGRFSAAIAHEIRNPVAMILSALTTAAGRGLPPEERQEMFDIAAKEAGRLERLTTDFLTYAHPRPTTKVRVDISDSVAYIADVCRPHASERHVELRYESPQGLWADADLDQLHQALLNLVMNAIEASPAGGRVTIHGSLEGPTVTIEVENDHGPIPDGAAAKIFEPFFTTKPSGTGLGLAIARGIILAHQGSLALSQNQADLVRFTISLPVQP